MVRRHRWDLKKSETVRVLGRDRIGCRPKYTPVLALISLRAGNNSTRFNDHSGAQIANLSEELLADNPGKLTVSDVYNWSLIPLQTCNCVLTEEHKL